MPLNTGANSSAGSPAEQQNHRCAQRMAQEIALAVRPHLPFVDPTLPPNKARHPREDLNMRTGLPCELS